MKGRVKNVNEEREFGFILGEDGNDYFFHFSNVISIDLPTTNSIVEFETKQTEKGASAINVKIEEKAIKKPEFIKFGSVRIRLKNIKSYTMNSARYQEERVFSFSCGFYDKPILISEKNLEVTTFQNEIFRFTSKHCDIDAKIAELDKYFNE